MAEKTGKRVKFYNFLEIWSILSTYIVENNLVHGDNKDIIVTNKNLRKIIGNIQALHWENLPIAILMQLDQSDKGEPACNFIPEPEDHWTLSFNIALGLMAIPKPNLLPIMNWKRTKDTGTISKVRKHEEFCYTKIVAAVLDYVGDYNLSGNWDIVNTRGNLLEKALKIRILDSFQIPQLILQHVTWNLPIEILIEKVESVTNILTGRSTEITVFSIFKSVCWNCWSQSGNIKIVYKCRGCRKARYCGLTCQTKDWQRHGNACMEMANRRVARARARADIMD